MLSVVDLPPDWRIHWTMRDKWVVAQAVRFGILAYDMACAKYLMHPEELDSWIDAARDGRIRDMQIKALDLRRPKRCDVFHGKL